MDVLQPSKSDRSATGRVAPYSSSAGARDAGPRMTSQLRDTAGIKSKDGKLNILWLRGILTKFNAPFPHDDADDPRRLGFSVGQQIVGLYLAEMLLKCALDHSGVSYDPHHNLHRLFIDLSESHRGEVERKYTEILNSATDWTWDVAETVDSLLCYLGQDAITDTRYLWESSRSHVREHVSILVAPRMIDPLIHALFIVLHNYPSTPIKKKHDTSRGSAFSASLTRPVSSRGNAFSALAPVSAPPEALILPGGWAVEGLPDIVLRAGPQAAERTVEFFTAQIRNPHTRAAYAAAVTRFFTWCDARGLELAQISPIAVATYIEEMQSGYRAPTIKQHLAAIRRLFDFLVIGQVVPANPAASVRGPTHVVRTGKTPKRGSCWTLSTPRPSPACASRITTSRASAGGCGSRKKAASITPSRSTTRRRPISTPISPRPGSRPRKTRPCGARCRGRAGSARAG